MRKFAVLLFCAVVSMGLATPQVRADFDAGVMAYANGDFEAAAREFFQLSEKGDMAGQYHMGLLYEEGQGVSQQFEAAVRCYTKAAEQGYVDAYFALGEIYLRQPGGKKDRVEADYWLGLAKKHGHPRGGDEFERNRKAMTPEQVELAKKTFRSAP